MVHLFKYNHKDRDYHFLWDVESGSLHNVDKPAYLTAKSIYGRLDSAGEINAFNSLSATLRKEIATELYQLEADGEINTPCYESCTDKKVGEIKALCLHICHDCNLKCKYCFADEGTYRTCDRAYMSYEVGKNAIDYMIKYSGNKHNLEVDFFGGEPLMNLDVVKQIVAYARGLESSTGKRFSFTMTTNCVLLDDSTIEWLDSEMHNIVLSIDGRKEVHDAVRRTFNGVSAYDHILNRALKMAEKRGGKSYYVRGTFTSRNLDFASDVLYLREQGFEQISVEPVVLADSDELAIKKEHLPIILAEYERLAKEYLDARANGKWFNFFHFMIDLDGGPCIKKRITGCGAGCEYFSVVPNGDVYPCHQFAEEDAYRIGNVFDKTLNLEVCKPFAKNVVANKPDCKVCPAKYYCSGGCAANNKHFAGDISVPYEISCEMMRKRFELSLAIAGIERAGIKKEF